MQMPSSWQRQTVSGAEAKRSVQESASLRTSAVDDQRRFTEGFIVGWSSMLGPRAVPTIIPNCAVPMGGSPFDHGYHCARAFVEACCDDALRLTSVPRDVV